MFRGLALARRKFPGVVLISGARLGEKAILESRVVVEAESQCIEGSL